MHCDYLVIGGGAAGCIVARRLAERGDARVLLVEAGKSDEGDPAATDLARLDEQDGGYDWHYLARPTAHSQRPIEYARAKILGGCANHNDCAFLAPPSSDFDRWAARGASDWDAAAVAPALARVEQALHIDTQTPGNPLSRAFIDAFVELGLPERNFRQGIAPGAGWFPLNARGRLRQSSSVAYLHPLAALPPNLEVWTETAVSRLRLDGRRVSGADTGRGPVHASREVILCAGSINSPQLLMLSGLGPADHLCEYGIPVVVDLPGVGRNLADHAAANITCELHAPAPPWERTFCEAAALVSIDAQAPAPDVLFHFVLRPREKYAGHSRFQPIAHAVTISPNVARPKSRGSVKLSGPDPHAKPRIDLGYFSDPEGYDRRIILGGLRYARRIAAAEALSAFLRREVEPGPDCESDEDLFDYVLETCETVYHPAGTCAMGDPGAELTVVAPDLKVKGVGGLRIADASVFPDMVTVNICNTVMMVAERAADLVAGEFPAVSANAG